MDVVCQIDETPQPSGNGGQRDTSKFVWEEPGRERANKARRKKFQSQGWFIDGSWKLIVEQVLERIYLMRCQLTHGAARPWNAKQFAPLLTASIAGRDADQRSSLSAEK